MAIKKNPRPWHAVVVDELRADARVERCEELAKEIRRISSQCESDPVRTRELLNMNLDLLIDHLDALIKKIECKKELKESQDRIEYN